MFESLTLEHFFFKLRLRASFIQDLCGGSMDKGMLQVTRQEVRATIIQAILNFLADDSDRGDPYEYIIPVRQLLLSRRMGLLYVPQRKIIKSLRAISSEVDHLIYEAVRKGAVRLPTTAGDFATDFMAYCQVFEFEIILLREEC